MMKIKQNTAGLVLLICTTLALGYCAKKKEDPTNTGDPVANAEAVSQAKDALEIGYAQGDSAGGITRNIELPTTGENEVTIAWAETSDTSNAIEISETNNADGNRVGTITRPESANAMVTLTATLTRGDATDTKEFMLTVSASGNPVTNAEAVSQAKTALEIGYASGESASGVTRDVTLPTTGANGVAIAWAETSDTSNAIEISETNNADGNRVGTITRPESANAMVTLTATLTKGNAMDTKEFMLTVILLSDENAVSQAKTALEIGYASGESASGVTRDVTLPTTGANGVAIAWAETSDTSNAIEISETNNADGNRTGTITRPSANAMVTLTATLTKGDATDTREFTLTVFPEPATDAAAVTQAEDALQVGYAPGDNVNRVTKNVTLPTEGPDGVTISWTSSDTDRITTAGVVNRLRHQYKQVVLTATLTKGDVSEATGFRLTVFSVFVWSRVTGGASWDARTGHDVVVFKGKMWVVGGNDGGETYADDRNDVWSSSDGVTWTNANARGPAMPDTDPVEYADHWFARAGHAAVVFDNKMWLMGGSRGNRQGDSFAALNDVWSSTDGQNWTKVEESRTPTAEDPHWPVRDAHVSVAFNNQIWIIGGASTGGSALRDVWSSNREGTLWTKANVRGPMTSDPLLSFRRSPAAITFNNKIWVMGGTTDSGGLNDVWSSADGVIWTRVEESRTPTEEDPHWPIRDSHTAVVFDGKIWVMGGFGPRNRLNDVWWSDDGENWTNTNATGHWSPRVGPAAVVFDNKLWVMGGNITRGNTNDVWVYQESN